MQVVATILGKTPGCKPVEQPYTRMDASALDALHAVIILIKDAEEGDMLYSIQKIEVRL